MDRGKLLSRIAGLCVLGLAAIPFARPRSSVPLMSKGPGGGVRDYRVEQYKRLPVSFEENRGQTDPRVRYLAHGRGYALFLTPSSAVLSLEPHGGEQNRDTQAIFSDQPGLTAPDGVLRMRLIGASRSARIVALDELPGKVNYFIGSHPQDWRSDVPTYAKVGYKGIYPGIDLTYYGNQGRLEYDFAVAPGADPETIQFAIETGKSKLEDREQHTRIAANGDLIVESGDDEFRFRRPIVYQPLGGAAATDLLAKGALGQRRSVSGHFVLLAKERAGFVVGQYDHSKPLIIDPTLVYSSYLGGSAADSANAIAVDSSGNAYVAGKTASSNFPTASAEQSGAANFPAAFVTKINASGSAILYSTYLGEQSIASGIAVDSSGDAYVTGGGQGIPTTSGAFQTQAASGAAFVVKLSAAGNQVTYGTYFGDNVTSSNAIAVDSAGDAAITGTTASQSLPIVNAAKSQCSSCGPGGPAGQNSYVAKFNASGSALVFSTYLGGSTTGQGNGIAVDSTGNIYVTGMTKATDFPTTSGAFQASFGGGSAHAYVTKFSPAGSIVYSTYLGGSSYDTGLAIAVDSSDNVYVTGSTQSVDFPTLNAYQSVYSSQKQAAGYTSAFVTKLNAAGSGIIYSTYLEGSESDGGSAIAVDSSGDVYVAGATRSSDFPTANAVQAIYGGSEDGFVTELAPGGNSLVYSTYMGGSGQDMATAIAVDSSADTYVAGSTQSTDFPTANPFQAASGGAGDAFVAKLDPPAASSGHRHRAAKH